MCMIVGLIVWTLQAVNYFDFVKNKKEFKGKPLSFYKNNYLKVENK